MSGTGPCACACAQAQRTDEDAASADTCAVIVAGGSGERFGDPRGKQFVELAGLPLAAWSILAFDRAPSVGYLVVVCPQGQEHRMREEVLAPLALRNPIALAPAGPERQDSVFSGLVHTPAEFSLVAIHDGARPLIEVDTIEAALAPLREAWHPDGTICASRSVDTLKLVDATGRIVGTPDRTQYWCAQTPQCFFRTAILQAHETALLEGYGGTDDASLVEHVGGIVCVVESPRDNIKVTMPEDLAVAEATLQARMGLA